MIHFYKQDCNYLPVNRLALRKWITEVIRREGYTAGEINYIFCSAERLLEINREFLSHDYYTDIITFDESDLRGEGVINGEIYIDVETVADNAAQFGATRLDEMRRVVVHGVLHLCGQKDKTPRAERQMHRKEDKYLAYWKR
jgi:rRNA maturation RNase YbeY